MNFLQEMWNVPPVGRTRLRLRLLRANCYSSSVIERQRGSNMKGLGGRRNVESGSGRGRERNSFKRSRERSNWEAMAAAAQPIVLVSTAFFNSNWSRKKSAEHTHGWDLWSRSTLSPSACPSPILLRLLPLASPFKQRRRPTRLILSDRKYHHHRDSKGVPTWSGLQDTRGIAEERVRIVDDQDETTKTKGRRPAEERLRRCTVALLLAFACRRGREKQARWFQTVLPDSSRIHIYSIFS